MFWLDVSEQVMISVFRGLVISYEVQQLLCTLMKKVAIYFLDNYNLSRYAYDLRLSGEFFFFWHAARTYLVVPWRFHGDPQSPSTNAEYPFTTRWRLITNIASAVY